MLNQAGKPERIVIMIDGEMAYSGLLGTVDYAPAIVIDRTLWLPKGDHRFSIDVPNRGFKKELAFQVDHRKPVTLVVVVNRDNIEAEVSYKVFAFL